MANGVRHVQGTINGYGERCGNANLVSILADLELKTPYEPVPSGRLAELTEMSRYVAEIVNIAPDDHQPYVGRSAFAHKGGVHGAATARASSSYQHVDPGVVGNVMRLVVSELGGKANTQLRAEQLGQQLDGVDPRALSQIIKQLEADGLAFEGAEASFELLVKRHKAGYERPFELCDYTVLVEQRGGAELLAEATVKVEVAGEVLHTAADGNGPVNALDTALRKALGRLLPGARRGPPGRLQGPHPRQRGGHRRPDAGHHRLVATAPLEWSTMGSGTNIIAASCQALCDSLEYAIWKTGAEVRRRDERHFTTVAQPNGAARAPARRPNSLERWRGFDGIAERGPLRGSRCRRSRAARSLPGRARRLQRGGRPLGLRRAGGRRPADLAGRLRGRPRRLGRRGRRADRALEGRQRPRDLRPALQVRRDPDRRPR